MKRSEPTSRCCLRETLDLLAPRAGSIVVDATLGAGGHAEALLDAIGPDGRLLGIDRDSDRPGRSAGARLARFGDAFVPLRGNHDDLVLLLRRGRRSPRWTAILFDLGVSSMQTR